MKNVLRGQRLQALPVAAAFDELKMDCLMRLQRRDSGGGQASQELRRLVRRVFRRRRTRQRHVKEAAAGLQTTLITPGLRCLEPLHAPDLRMFEVRRKQLNSIAPLALPTR
jgi:hypothetical protein